MCTIINMIINIVIIIINISIIIIIIVLLIITIAPPRRVRRPVFLAGDLLA